MLYNAWLNISFKSILLHCVLKISETKWELSYLTLHDVFKASCSYYMTVSNNEQCVKHSKTNPGGFCRTQKKNVSVKKDCMIYT